MTEESGHAKRFKAPAKKAVEWKPTKYDGFKLVKKGDYRFQKGSGRAQCLELAKDGMLVGTWTKKCAEIGFESVFPVNCIQKLMTTKEPGWAFSDKNDKGMTVKEVTASRSEEGAKAKKEKAEAKAAKAAAKGEAKGKPKKDAKPEPKGKVIKTTPGQKVKPQPENAAE